jgi:hypothetical protein
MPAPKMEVTSFVGGSSRKTTSTYFAWDGW